MGKSHFPCGVSPRNNIRSCYLNSHLSVLNCYGRNSFPKSLPGNWYKSYFPEDITVGDFLRSLNRFLNGRRRLLKSLPLGDSYCRSWRTLIKKFIQECWLLGYDTGSSYFPFNPLSANSMYHIRTCSKCSGNIGRSGFIGFSSQQLYKRGTGAYSRYRVYIGAADFMR